MAAGYPQETEPTRPYMWKREELDLPLAVSSSSSSLSVAAFVVVVVVVLVFGYHFPSVVPEHTFLPAHSTEDDKVKVGWGRQVSDCLR